MNYKKELKWEVKFKKKYDGKCKLLKKKNNFLNQLLF